jgi:hypothetical protein
MQAALLVIASTGTRGLLALHTKNITHPPSLWRASACVCSRTDRTLTGPTHRMPLPASWEENLGGGLNPMTLHMFLAYTLCRLSHFSQIQLLLLLYTHMNSLIKLD